MTKREIKNLIIQKNYLLLSFKTRNKESILTLKNEIKNLQKKLEGDLL